MHASSFEKMKNFVNQYLCFSDGKERYVLDVGSCDVNGTYKTLFPAEQWRYIGVDLEEGPNVDVIIKTPYNWSNIRSNSFDVVISGQTFEHIEYIWITISEIHRVLKIGGYGCIIAPSGGPEHKYPKDCWRIYPDGFVALAQYAGLDVIKVETDWQEKFSNGSINEWKDGVLIFRKSKKDMLRTLRFWLRNKFLRYV